MRAIILFLACLACLPCEGRIQTVIFDFGKVIATIDSELLIEFISSSCKLSQESATEVIQRFGEHQRQGGEEKAFWKEYQKQYHVPYSDAMWRRQWSRAQILAMKEIPGMLNLVEALQKKGFQTAIFSNVTSECAEIVTKAGFYDYFDPLFLSYKMKVEKPHPEAYEKVLKKLALPADACLFIDDRPENIQAAHEMGFDTILFENPAQLVEELNKRGINVKLKEAAHAA